MTQPHNSENATDMAGPSRSPSHPSGHASTSSEPPLTSNAPSMQTNPLHYCPSTSTSPPSPPHALPLNLLDIPDPAGGRLEPDPASIARLANSLAQLGLLNPITVQPNGPRFTVVAGRRRLAAAKKLGWTHISATHITGTDATIAAATAAENIARSNLTPVEEALLLQPLVEHDPNGIDGVASALGRTRNWIDSRLELLDWPESLAIAIHAHKISMAAARLLARIPDPELREQRIRDAINHGINARTASLWLQFAMTPELTESEMSQNSAPHSHSPITTKTFVVCVRCERELELEQTRPTRICHECLSQLAPSFPQQPQHEEIPTPPDLPSATDHP